MRQVLKLENRAHVGINEFKEINWLSTKERFEQCVCTNIFKICLRNMYLDLTMGTASIYQSANYTCHTETAIMAKRQFHSLDPNNSVLQSAPKERK